MEISMFPSIKNTCAVIVTYFPDDDIIHRLAKIQEQVHSIIIVDNASSIHCLSILRNFSKAPEITLIENNKNMGLGKALNQAASLAIESGYEWILIFDQDTTVHPDIFSILASIYVSGNGTFLILGSNYYDNSRKRPFKKCNQKSGKLFIKRRTVITSGTLLNLSLYINIGGFREDYFIDSIDHEYCLRIRSQGLPIAMSCKIIMSHTIGQADSTKKPIITFEHPAFRKYYMARNTILTIKQYWLREPVWSFLQLARLSIELVSIVFIEDNKKNKAFAFFCGITDAIKNKMGPMEQSADEIRQ